MNVKELKEAIDSLPDDMQVILQKDAEGNGYSPLEGVDTECIYIAHSTWDGEVWSTEWTAEDADMDEEDWEDFKKNPRSLVLYPIN